MLTFFPGRDGHLSLKTFASHINMAKFVITLIAKSVIINY